MMIDILKKAKQTIIEPEGAFYVMIDVAPYFGKSYNGKTIKQAQDIAEMLLDSESVLTIPCEAFGADDFLRLSYATSEAQIECGLARIIEFFKKLK